MIKSKLKGQSEGKSYFDYSDKEKKRIIMKAAKESSKVQREMMAKPLPKWKPTKKLGKQFIARAHRVKKILDEEKHYQHEIDCKCKCHKVDSYFTSPCHRCLEEIVSPKEERECKYDCTTLVGQEQSYPTKRQKSCITPPKLVKR